MTTPRPWGSGSVSPHLGQWRARLPGRYGRATVGLFATPEAAADALAAALEDIAASPIEVATLATWGAEWMATRDVRPGTLARDRARWRAYVERHELGALPLGAVARVDVEAWLASLRHLAPQTRQNALGLLRQALAAACSETGPLAGRTSPADGVALGRRARERTERGWDWLRAHEVERVMLATLTPKQRAAITVAIFTGLRAGELWGLRWEDVDADRGVLHVRHSRAEATKGGQPREVPLLVPARVALKRWQAHCAREGVRSHLGLVFPAPDGGHHADGYDADWPEVWRTMHLAAPRRVRFHDLRHTFASHVLQGTWAPWWIARPLRIEEVRDLLGHADITTTQRYAHLCRDGVAALFAQQRDTERDTESKPPRRFELRTYGLRKRGPGDVSTEESAASAGAVSRAVSSLADAALRCAEAVASSDPWRDRRAMELVEAAERVVEAMRAMEAKREVG